MRPRLRIYSLPRGGLEQLIRRMRKLGWGQQTRNRQDLLPCGLPLSFGINHGFEKSLFLLALVLVAAALHVCLYLRRHVVLVVLGEDFIGTENAVRAERAARNHPLFLAEEVGQDAGVSDGKRRMLKIGDAKTHGEAVTLARERMLLDHTADADAGLLQRHRFFGDALQRIVVVQIILHRIKQERDGGSESGKNQADEG